MLEDNSNSSITNGTIYIDGTIVDGVSTNVASLSGGVGDWSTITYTTVTKKCLICGKYVYISLHDDENPEIVLCEDCEECRSVLQKQVDKVRKLKKLKDK